MPVSSMWIGGKSVWSLDGGNAMHISTFETMNGNTLNSYAILLKNPRDTCRVKNFSLLNHLHRLKYTEEKAHLQFRIIYLQILVWKLTWFNKWYQRFSDNL